MEKTFSMEFEGRTLSAEIGRVAGLANGAALVRYGDTVILASVTASEKPREGVDFFPLSVDYEEKTYAAGKIPGGFLKREGKPSEHAVLTSRVIDRPIRPLFPKDYRNDVSIITQVVCADPDAMPETLAMVAASIVLSISDIPFAGPIGAVNVGYVDGELVINPTEEQRRKTDLSITVASTKEKVVMIEAGANEIPEDIMLEAVKKGHAANQQIVDFIKGIQDEIGKEKAPYEQVTIPEEIYNEVTAYITEERMREAVFADAKEERHATIGALTDEVTEHFTEVNPDAVPFIGDIIYKFEKLTVRKMILREHQRVDGRGLTDMRQLYADVDILPRTHGSAIFSRGQTQVLTVTTLGPLSDAQIIDGLDTLETEKRYMHHYNFPGYSVGEAKPLKSPGRREIGHGALAERALLPVIPSEEEFPYALRLVSEVMSSNGSTSQASVCGSTLSLMAAGVPIKRPVAGISVGLVTGEDTSDYITITDIQGIEDFFGDMDFKVAGTEKGITAIQMDIKIQGLTLEIIEKAFAQAREARMKILNEVILKRIPEPRKELSKFAPIIKGMEINPEKIAEVIGTKGKVINKIIEDTGVKIDITDDGHVSVCGVDVTMVDKAMEIISTIVNGVEVGRTYVGKVTKIIEIGAFVELIPGKEGMIHISKLSKGHVDKVEDVVAVGDEVIVKVEKIDERDRVNLVLIDKKAQ
ncbi:MAG: polyribonucleotide nucleotidyltransferase [Clostridia bacterium]|nr:polyribonucleotide nucleotidyltransferase [Clostridia bacterium]